MRKKKPVVEVDPRERKIFSIADIERASKEVRERPAFDDWRDRGVTDLEKHLFYWYLEA